MKDITQIITLALLVEAIWENLKMVKQKDKISVDRIGAIAIGILLSVNYKIDIFTTVNIATDISVIGMVCTGILGSRGANAIHDIFSKIKEG